MSDEYKLSRAIGKQAQAQALLHNELLQETFAYLEKVYVDTWKDCEDQALRDELWRSQANLRNVQTQLKKVVADGRLAQREIDMMGKLNAA
jgi:hypothetical protein